MNPRRIPSAAIVFCSLGLMTFAQETAPPASSSEPDESVQLSPFEVSARGDRGYNTANTVGATLLNTAILNTPMSIDVLNSEFIHDVAATDPIYAAAWISGVTTASSGPGVGQEIIRGQNLNPGTAIRDGVYEPIVATGLVFQDQALIDRVEVIKGPEGALYGDFSGQGGLINLVSKRPQPTDFTTTSVFIGADEFGGTIYRGVIDTNGVDPKNRNLEYRLVVVGQQGKTLQGWQDSTFIISPMVEYHFPGGGSAMLRYSHQNPDRSLGAGDWFVDVGGNYSTFISRYHSFNQQDVGDNLALHNVDFEFNQPFNTGPIHWDGRFFFRYDHMDDIRTEYNAPSAGVQFLSATGTVIGNQNNTLFSAPGIATMEFASVSRQVNQDWVEGADTNIHVVGQFELGPSNNSLLLYGTQLNESVDENQHGWTYPGSILYSTVPGLVTDQQYLPPTTVEGTETTLADSDVLTQLDAVGAQDNSSFLGDRINLVAGIRNDHQNQTTFNRLAKTEVPGDIRKGTTRKYGIVVRPLDWIGLFYNYSETFSPNGFGTNVSGQSYKLPNLQTWINEEGAKLGFFHNRLTISGSYFKTIVANELVPETGFTPSGASVLIMAPAGEGIIQGWEGDGTWAVSENIDLLFGAGNLKSVTQTGLEARNVPIGTNYRLFAKYKFTQGSLRGAYVGAGLQHNGPRALTATNNGYLPPYTVYSALAGYRWGRHWEVQLNVYNLTNADFPLYGIAVNAIMPANPRNYSGTLTYNY